jgi:hypothetical protein
MKRLVLSLLFTLAACTGGQTVSLTVDDATYRPPLVDGGTGVAYFSITSNIADRIVNVSSPDAAAIEIHESGDAGGMASMHRVESVELPAGKTVKFGPGGLHLMVISPAPQHANAIFRIQIELESGRTQDISIDAAKPGGQRSGNAT